MPQTSRVLGASWMSIKAEKVKDLELSPCKMERPSEVIELLSPHCLVDMGGTATDIQEIPSHMWSRFMDDDQLKFSRRKISATAARSQLDGTKNHGFKQRIANDCSVSFPECQHHLDHP